MSQEALSGAASPQSSPFPEIPGYEIESVIGRGATGVVYRARQLAVDREVALKVIHRELSAKSRTIQRLQREARTTARLAHPHIVSAIDMGETHGLWWFAMELVDGPSLALRLRQEGRLSEREALRLFIQLGEALAHMHEHGVVHRDIKPANILIDRTGNAMLADLGLAFADTDPSLTGSEGTLGTPHYISPEQSKDPSSVDIRTDIWSLGATLFHALCGRPPFGGASLAEVLSGVLYAPIPDPLTLEPELSPGLALVVRKCLSRSLGLRYQTPAELIGDLERVRERRKPKVRATALEPLEGGWPPWVVRAGVGGVIAVVLLGWWLLQVHTFAPVDARRYEPLEAAAARADEGGGKLAGALSDLAAMQGALPPGQLERWTEVQARARGLLRDELERLSSELSDRLDPVLARGEINQARATLDAQIATRLPLRTGFSIGGLPSDMQAWFTPLEERIHARRAELERAASAELLAYVERELLAQAAELAAAQRWSEAVELVSLDSLALLARARIDVQGLPEPSRTVVCAPALSLLSARRGELERDWRDVDLELTDWIARRALELESELAATRVVGAATKLRAECAQQFDARGIDRSQALASSEQWRRQLEQSCFELRERENRLRSTASGVRREAVDALFAWLDEQATLEAWRLRDYEAVRSYWKARAAELSSLTESADAEPDPLIANKIELRLREVERVEHLLERAVEGARNMTGQWLTLQVRSIAVRGALRATIDPLHDGLRISQGGADAEYVLRMRRKVGERVDAAEVFVSTDDLLMFATLAGGVDPLDAAVFQLREGALDAAAVALAAVEPTVEVALVDELRERVRSAVDLGRQRGERRAAEAQALLAKVERWAEQPAERLRLREAVQLLLEQYGDLREVSARRDWLRAQRSGSDGETAEVAPPQSEPQWREALRKQYLPDSLQFLTEGRARLRYTFGGSSAGAVQLGTWRADGLGWSRSESVPTLAELAACPGPSLDLAPLLDVSGNLDVILEIEQHYEDGAPRLFAVAVGGACVALLGDGMPERRSPGWIALAGGLAELLPKLATSEVRPLEHGPQPGSKHQLRIEIQRNQGRVVIDLDGARLGRPTLGLPSSPDTRLRIWSWEPVRLTGLAITAERP
jgi:tRNA A-37 threonylcarbamoyl transferase component Bud32